MQVEILKQKPNAYQPVFDQMWMQKKSASYLFATWAQIALYQMDWWRSVYLHLSGMIDEPEPKTIVHRRDLERKIEEDSVCNAA